MRAIADGAILSHHPAHAKHGVRDGPSGDTMISHAGTSHSGLTAALARSSLHLALLQHNAPAVDLVLYRDAHIAAQVDALFPGRGVFLGREQRLSLNPRAYFSNFIANRRYYAKVRSQIEGLGIARLILFLEGEPLERSILDWYAGTVELWEEGLSHYVDLTSPWWYAARGMVQIAGGFYPKGALHRRADRGAMIVRDRFATKDLMLPLPQRAAVEDQVLVIGSPLVEDRLVGRATWREGLAQIVAASPWPVKYLPHPREDKAALPGLLAQVGGLELAALPHGIAAHAEVHGYRAFVAAVSTALLDLGAFDDSLFVAELFGQKRIGRVLRGWVSNPVAVAASAADVAAFFRREPVSGVE